MINHSYIFSILVMCVLFFQQVHAEETETTLLQRMSKDGFEPFVAQYPYIIQGVEYDIGQTPRYFNFDGKNDFLNRTTHRSDYAVLQSNGIVISGVRITPNGLPSNIMKMLDPDLPVASTTNRIQVSPTDRPTSGGFRSQLSTYYLPPYKTYRWILKFRLDKNWPIAGDDQDGILWQIKGQPKIGQSGNPVIGLALSGDQLYVGWSYPFRASQNQAGDLQWTAKDYGAQNLPRIKINPGQYYDIEFEYFADDRINGYGYFKAWLNSELWFTFDGPTLHPDQTGPHYMAFGWYQWAAAPKQIRRVYWAKNRAFIK